MRGGGTDMRTGREGGVAKGRDTFVLYTDGSGNLSSQSDRGIRQPDKIPAQARGRPTLSERPWTIAEWARDVVRLPCLRACFYTASTMSNGVVVVGQKRPSRDRELQAQILGREFGTPRTGVGGRARVVASPAQRAG